jgi:hypothetical protein
MIAATRPDFPNVKSNHDFSADFLWITVAADSLRVNHDESDWM